MKKKNEILINDFDYNLPEKLIAQKPCFKRDNCRILFLNKNNSNVEHGKFFQIVDKIGEGDVLILNNSKVFPARLHGKKVKTGGQVEVFLHHLIIDKKYREGEVWETLIQGNVRLGTEVIFSSNLKGKIIEKGIDGIYLFVFNQQGNKLFEILNTVAEVPLPPYIKRNEGILESDKTNYQTVFANDKELGSSAAPTAGLHFTKEMLNELEKKGVEIIYLTLHVGLGTFSPVKTQNMLDHKMHKEFVSIDTKNFNKILANKKNGKRIIAVGTTSCRALESLAILNEEKKLDLQKKKISFWTDIYIYPGYKFKLTDALITNFHLPKSTLLLLVSALAGKESIKAAYQMAIGMNYRFFSYGDAMFIY